MGDIERRGVQINLLDRQACEQICLRAVKPLAAAHRAAIGHEQPVAGDGRQTLWREAQPAGCAQGQATQWRAQHAVLRDVLSLQRQRRTGRQRRGGHSRLPNRTAERERMCTAIDRESRGAAGIDLGRVQAQRGGHGQRALVIAVVDHAVQAQIADGGQHHPGRAADLQRARHIQAGAAGQHGQAAAARHRRFAASHAGIAQRSGRGTQIDLRFGAQLQQRRVDAEPPLGGEIQAAAKFQRVQRAQTQVGQAAEQVAADADGLAARHCGGLGLPRPNQQTVRRDVGCRVGFAQGNAQAACGLARSTGIRFKAAGQQAVTAAIDLDVHVQATGRAADGLAAFRVRGAVQGRTRVEQRAAAIGAHQRAGRHVQRDGIQVDRAAGQHPAAHKPIAAGRTQELTRHVDAAGAAQAQRVRRLAASDQAGLLQRHRAAGRRDLAVELQAAPGAQHQAGAGFQKDLRAAAHAQQPAARLRRLPAGLQAEADRPTQAGIQHAQRRVEPAAAGEPAHEAPALTCIQPRLQDRRDHAAGGHVKAALPIQVEAFEAALGEEIDGQA